MQTWRHRPCSRGLLVIRVRLHSFWLSYYTHPDGNDNTHIHNHRGYQFSSLGSRISISQCISSCSVQYWLEKIFILLYFADSDVADSRWLIQFSFYVRRYYGGSGPCCMEQRFTNASQPRFTKAGQPRLEMI